MKKKISFILRSTEFAVILGLVILPLVSFSFLLSSPESPLYTSISRLAWVHGRWLSTFLWAVIVGGAVVWLSYRVIFIGPLRDRAKRIIFSFQLCSICLVFVGCLIFPAKADEFRVGLLNYVHDYLTASAWCAYGVGWIVYSILIGRKNKALGFMGCSFMAFALISSMFFLRQVIDPESYVGASAVSEVYIINSLLIYLAVMLVLEDTSIGRIRNE